MEALSCRKTWEKMMEVSESGLVYNFHQLIDMENFLVETELFDAKTLDIYSRWNLGAVVTEDEKKAFSPEKGGQQGNYRHGMPSKIQNVIDCLNRFPKSKRAVITISNNPLSQHELDADAKCMREIHFRLDKGSNTLHGTVFFRAQSATIFPKNIHFIGCLLQKIAQGLSSQPKIGTVFYLTSVLAGERHD